MRENERGKLSPYSLIWAHFLSKPIFKFLSALAGLSMNGSTGSCKHQQLMPYHNADHRITNEVKLLPCVLKSHKHWRKLNLYQIDNRFFLCVLLHLVSSLHIHSTPSFQVSGLDQKPEEVHHPPLNLNVSDVKMSDCHSQHSWRPMELRVRVGGGRR